MDLFNVKTIENDEEYLRQVSKDVVKGDPELKEDIKVLESYCNQSINLFAIAAIQLGIPKKIIYICCIDENDVTKENVDERIIMINPELIEEKGETYFWEACESCMDNTGKVKRPYQIKVKYYDENFEEKEETFEGLKATIFSHEYDHLHGILHMDIAEEIKHMNVDERIAFRKKDGNGYVVLSKTKEYKHPLREY